MSVYYSKMDLKTGLSKILINPDKQKILTIFTHKGLFWLLFEITTLAIFQKKKNS